MSTRRIDSYAESHPGLQARALPVVCVVDTDPAVHSSVRALVTMLGAEVRAFDAAAPLFAALDAMDVAPACIVADLVLPDLGGLQLLAELRRRGFDIPTIIVAAEPDVQSAVGAMRAGAVDFIEKPYIERALLNQIAPLVRPDDGQH